MKVLFVTNWFPSKDKPYNGIFIREHAYSVSLYNEVKILVYRIADTRQNKYIKFRDEKYRNLEITNLYVKSFLGSNLIFRIYGTIKYLKKIKREGWVPDIVNANIFSSALPWIVLNKFPVVWIEHFSRVALNMLSFKERILFKIVSRFVNGIIAVSKDLSKRIKKNYGVKRKIYVVPNTVDTSLFFPYKSKRMSKKKVIITVVSLRKIKGIEYLLKAVSLLKNYNFILKIVGDGEDRENLMNLTKRLKINNKIRFLGYQPKEEIAKLLRKSDFFVLPSLYENLPVVLIEAIASGLPIVATDVGGVKELINNKIGKLIPPGNVEKLKDAIEYMLDNCSSYSSEYIAKYAQKNFSYGVVGKKLTKVYKEILKYRNLQS